ncbi:unnamed protein product, partial [Ectocarpus sp. 4 AP-2014]
VGLDGCAVGAEGIRCTVPWSQASRTSASSSNVDRFDLPRQAQHETNSCKSEKLQSTNHHTHEVRVLYQLPVVVRANGGQSSVLLLWLRLRLPGPSSQTHLE